MRSEVEVGGWEHDCCGPAYERDTVVELTCVARGGDRNTGAHLVETHHGVDPEVDVVRVRGRIAEIAIAHPDGTVEAIHRLPSGRALRGFDEHDDGHLERPWTGEPVVADSEVYVITLV